MVVVQLPLLRRERDRRPQPLALPVRIERCRHDADHRVRLAVQPDRPPDDPGISLEAVLPKSVRQHDHPVRTRDILSGKDCPACGGENIEHLEETRRHQRTGHALRRILRRQVEARPAHRRHRLERPAQLLPVDEVSRRYVAGAAAVRLRHRHHPLGLAERERPQHHRVHHAEDRRRAADAHRQREPGRQRERRRRSQLPQRVSRVRRNVHQQGPEPLPPGPPPPQRLALPAHPVQVARVAQHLRPRLLRRQPPPRHQLPRPHLHVKRELVLHFPRGIRPEYRPLARSGLRGHDARSGLRIRSTPAANRAHASASRSARDRPSAVNR